MLCIAMKNIKILSLTLVIELEPRMCRDYGHQKAIHRLVGLEVGWHLDVLWVSTSVLLHS